MSKKHSLRWSAGSRTPHKTYITRVFNYGTLKEWKAMRKKFAKRVIEEAVKNPLRGQWTPRGKAFAEVLTRHKMPTSVLISYDAHHPH